MFPLPHILGDYTLTELITTTDAGALYVAIQQGMGRTVFLELFDPDNAAGITQVDFIARARVRATLNAALLGTVYEAALAEGRWLLTSEYLGDRCLGKLRENKETLSVNELLDTIDAVGKACERYIQSQQAFQLIDLSHIFIDAQSHVRIVNTAIPSSCDAEAAGEQMRLLGRLLPALVPEGVPGRTRLLTLLEWMRDGEGGKPLTWAQVDSLVEVIKGQLKMSQSLPCGGGPSTEKNPIPLPPPVTANSKKRLVLYGLLIFLIAGLSMGVMFLSRSLTTQKPSAPPPPPPQRPYADFAARELTTVRVHLPSLRKDLIVGAHEITIEAYQSFLNSWKTLRPETRLAYSHPDQPDKETATHKPADWDAILAAAESGGKWDGRKLSMRSPVMNVTFWDAYAFAAWKPVPAGTPRFRLPTCEEWHAIGELMQTDEEGDKTLNIDRYRYDFDHETGICGMASGLKEWTESMARDPFVIKGGVGPVTCGGDWKNPGITDSQEYLRSRDEHYSDLGFRIVRDPEP